MSSFAVTGASRGIGLALVRHLSAANQKNTVYALARKPEGAQQLQEFASDNMDVHVVQCDLDDRNSIKKAAEEVGKHSGGTIDVLINNGALLYHERNFTSIDKFPDEETLENDMMMFFKTNAIGVMHTINAFLPLLRAPSPNKVKKIIVITSGSGSPALALATGNGMTPAYSLSKAAANMLVAKFATALKAEAAAEGKNEFMVAGLGPALVKTLPQSPETDARYEGIADFVRVHNPNFKGPISPAESAAELVKLVDRLTPADTGALLHATGSDINGLDF